MNEITELKMVIDATFSSILHEIQLSNLNFSLQITPFSAYITLKKSVVKDQNGIKAVPAPPVLLLLQQAQQTIAELQEVNERLKIKSDKAEKTIESLVAENAVLVDAIDASKNDLATSNIKLEAAEEKILKFNSYEASLKDIKKSHLQKINHANSTIKALEKNEKVLEKEIHNLKRNLERSRDSLKNLISDNSSLKIGKAKLETEKRRLEKLVSQRDLKVSNLIKKEDIDHNKNQIKLEDSAALVSTQISSVSSISNLEPCYTSMIAHWNPLPVKNSSMSNLSISMVTHSIKLPPPSCSLFSSQEFQEMIDKMCARVFAKLGWDK